MTLPWGSSRFDQAAAHIAGGAFTPASLPGLVGWYAAGVGTYSDAGITASVNSGPIQQWNDQSGAGNHLIQLSGGGQKPTYLSAGFNGKPTVQFSVGGIFMQSANGVAMGGSNKGAGFIAGFITASTNTFARILGYAAPGQTLASGANSAAFLINLGATTTVGAFQSGGLSNETIVNNTNYRLGSVFDGTNSKTYVNNATSGGTAQGAFTWTTGGSIIIGADTAGNNAVDGNISEVIVCNADITANLTQLDDYFKRTWGL